MTPERQRWWDSLPAEEKCVRIAIKKEKSYMSFYKSDGALNIRGFIKYQKLLIKALRKQIAMRPVDNNGIVKCPVCREILYDKEFLIIKTLCCPDCGQKLRWE